MKKIVFEIFTTFFVFFLSVFSNAQNAVSIIQTTDIHGEAGVCSDKPGIARIATFIENQKLINSPSDNLILIDCGDLTQGSFAASLNKGKFMISALNALEYDVWVPGNHDFDYGTSELINRIAEFNGTTLAANIKFTDLENQPHKPWILIKKQNLKIAIIGVTAPYLEQWIGPEQLKGVTISNAIDSIRRIMPSVMKEKPDVIILAIHLGEFISGRLNADGKMRTMTSIAAEFPQIDLISGGHTHENQPGKKLGSYAWFVQSPPLSAGVAKINIAVTKGDKKITSEIVPIKDLTESEKIIEIISEARLNARNLASQEVANVPFELEQVNSVSKENRLAMILAHAIANEVQTPIAFSTTLSSHKFKGGKIDNLEIFRLVPYENLISIIEITPDEAKMIIEEQLSLKQSETFMHAYGLSYTADKNGKITDDLILANGKKWIEGRKKCALASYAASGAGGRYPALKKIAENGKVNRTDTFLTVRDAFSKYLAKNYPPE